jgi:putative transposase
MKLTQSKEGGKIMEKKNERIALFRFGIISSLISLRKSERGEKERIIREITQGEWDIPYSGRSYISRATVLSWLKRYRQSGERLESLMPKERCDRGDTKSIDPETQQALIKMRGEFRNLSVPVLLDMAHDAQIIPVSFSASMQSVYRLFKRHGLDETFSNNTLKKFEAELPNDLWQSDCMHGPQIVDEGKKKKTYLFAIIDDHSRLIVHAQFYLRENIESYIDCYSKALRKRGLPRKLYLDNGPCFRSHRLKYASASLGVVLIHATAYHPEGKGKIERWFKTVRAQFLPRLKQSLTLEEINRQLHEWINQIYHLKIHGSTAEKPLDRFTKSVHLLRAAPYNLNGVFRSRLKRRVTKDRIVSINNKLYEASVGLAGKTVELLFDNHQEKIEIFYKTKSYGYLQRLDAKVNYRIKTTTKPSTNQNDDPKNGKLFS